MGIEQRFEISNSQIVNPREFLSRPPWEGWGELDVGRLAAQPSRKLLRRLPKVVDEFGDPYEVNMVRRKGVWFLYKTALFYNKV